MSFPADPRTPAAALFEDYERRIRQQFFGHLPDKVWFQQSDDIARMVAWPVVWLRNRGVALPAERIREILDGIIKTVQQHGKTGAVQWFASYFETVVKSHMNHHGEEYYEEARRLRAMAFLSKLKRTPAEEFSDDVSRVCAVLSGRKKGGRKRTQASAQPDLFGTDRQGK
jgi:hypothetical protein